MGVVTGVCAAAFRRSPACTALVCRFTLFPLPSNAGLGVLEHNALLQKLLANAVRGREIPGFLGGRAFRDQPFHFGILKLAALGPRLEHIENGVEEHYSMDSFSTKLPNGKYIANLYFAETFDGITGPGQRVFSYKVQGKEFKDFDIWAKTGGANRAYIETVPVEVT